MRRGQKYFVGLLSSSLLSFFFRKNSNKIITNTFPRISILDMKGFPIRNIDFKNVNDKSLHDQIVILVDQMLEAKQKLTNAKNDAETNRLALLCTSLDRQIDEAVYELYGLTEEEIKIVEGQ